MDRKNATSVDFESYDPSVFRLTNHRKAMYGHHECPAPFSMSSGNSRIVGGNPVTPQGSYMFMTVNALDAAVPVSRHSGFIRDLPNLTYLFRASRSYREDYTCLRMTQAESESREGRARVRQAQKTGAMTVVALSPDPHVGPGCETELLGELCSLHVEKQCQDHFARSEGQDHVRMTIESFLRLIPDDLSCYNLLDFSAYSQNDCPFVVFSIADDRISMHSTKNVPSKADLDDHASWVLATHPFSYTRIHHDSSGYGTYMRCITGTKLWFYLVWVVQPTPQLFMRRLKCAQERNVAGLEYSEDPAWLHETHAGKEDTWNIDYEQRRLDPCEHLRVARWHVVEFAQDMLLIQPSNTMHEVYNVTASICHGGHFVSWESLPRMRNARRMDAIAGDATITNALHAATDHLLGTMLVALEPSKTHRNRRMEARSNQELDALHSMLADKTFYTPQIVVRDEADLKPINDPEYSAFVHKVQSELLALATHLDGIPSFFKLNLRRDETVPKHDPTEHPHGHGKKPKGIVRSILREIATLKARLPRESDFLDMCSDCAVAV